MNYVVITVLNGGDKKILPSENGKVIIFPDKFEDVLLPGTKVIYQGEMHDNSFYFGNAEVVKTERIEDGCLQVVVVNNDDKGGVGMFDRPVPVRRSNGNYFEGIDSGEEVRPISKKVYDDIVAAGTIGGDNMNEYNCAIISDNSPTGPYPNVIGNVYYFPIRYAKFLLPGTRVIYHRGSQYSAVIGKKTKGLSHYFGQAVIGTVSIAPSGASSGMLCASIFYYRPFNNKVPFNNKGKRYETGEGKFWRNGVRKTTRVVFDEIVADSNFFWVS